jgi:lysophospholipase L1-like esterase
VDPNKKITVWMVGDSTMQNCAGSGQCGWAAEFQQYFNANATISNQARGGRSIQTWIWGDPNVSKTAATDANGDCQVIDKTTYSDNLTTMLDPTNGMKPGDWVYVAFGINDGTATCNRHVSKTLFQSDLDFMATTIGPRARTRSSVRRPAGSHVPAQPTLPTADSGRKPRPRAPPTMCR